MMNIVDFFFNLLLAFIDFVCHTQVPALVLDCEPNIDFNKDIDAKRQYVFFHFTCLQYLL